MGWVWACLAVCALSALVLAACAAPPTPAIARPTDVPETLSLAASTAAAPLLRELGRAFQREHPAVILAGLDETYNAAQVQAQVAEGTLSLAGIEGTPQQELWAAPLAVDALAVIVHADNPLASLTLAQLRQVFAGRTWRWSELDVQVAGDEIIVASREAGSGTRIAFEGLALRAGPDQDPLPVTTMAVLRLSSAEMAAWVAAHPAAIGYVALGALEGVPERAKVKVLAIEGVAPGPEPVASGAYPLSLPLYLVAPAEPTGVAREFLDFALGPEGQRIVARQYVPVK